MHPPPCSARWAASLPPDERPSGTDTRLWDAVWGDRCQQLVWIGVDMDEGALRAMLDGCLLTDAEMELGPQVGRGLGGEGARQGILGAGAKRRTGEGDS